MRRRDVDDVDVRIRDQGLVARMGLADAEPGSEGVSRLAAAGPDGRDAEAVAQQVRSLQLGDAACPEDPPFQSLGHASSPALTPRRAGYFFRRKEASSRKPR